MQVSEGRELLDPPLLRLENEAGNAYLSMLTTLYSEGLSSMREGAHVETRMLEHCSATLTSFEVHSTIPLLLLSKRPKLQSCTEDVVVVNLKRFDINICFCFKTEYEPHLNLQMLKLKDLLRNLVALFVKPFFLSFYLP